MGLQCFYILVSFSFLEAHVGVLRRSKIARFSNIMILCTFSVSRSFHEKNQKTYDISQGKFMSYNLLCILAISSIFLLVVESWNRQHHGPTIYPTEKLNSMNFFFFGLWHGHDYFWPPWRLLDAKQLTATAHFGTLT